MTTATPKTQVKTIEKFAHPTTLEGRSLRHFVHCDNGQHVVVMELAADEPMIWRRGTVEEARAAWSKARKSIIAEGFASKGVTRQTVTR